MSDNTVLANAIAALAAAVAAIRPPAVTPKIYEDPFATNDPFDLSSRVGSNAFLSSSAPLDVIWDGDVANFPSFVVALRLRAKEAKWDAAGDSGILTISGKDILTEYHSISTTDIEAARTARTNNRALQNSRAMYSCIKNSIKGDIRDTIFTQFDNIPDYEDGDTLFKKITTFTTVASLQLSMLSFTNILNFSPSDHQFNIATINSKLIHLFILSTTSSRTLDEAERISHTINVYKKIVQPESWAQWVRTKEDSFEEGNITVCQSFMNAAVMKYNKIICEMGKFTGSMTTVQEDIVAMVAKQTKKRGGNDFDSSKRFDQNKRSKVSANSPPFVNHHQDASGNKYKLGDTQEFNSRTFFFCGCPDHRLGLKWHTHPPTKCKVRIAWLAKQQSASNSVVPSALLVTDQSSDDATATTTATPSVSPTDTSVLTAETPNLQALLASAMNMVPDNEAVRDMIAEVLNATAEL